MNPDLMRHTNRPSIFPILFCPPITVLVQKGHETAKEIERARKTAKTDTNKQTKKITARKYEEALKQFSFPHHYGAICLQRIYCRQLASVLFARETLEDKSLSHHQHFGPLKAPVQSRFHCRLLRLLQELSGGNYRAPDKQPRRPQEVSQDAGEKTIDPLQKSAISQGALVVLLCTDEHPGRHRASLPHLEGGRLLRSCIIHHWKGGSHSLVYQAHFYLPLFPPIRWEEHQGPHTQCIQSRNTKKESIPLRLLFYNL